jgi:hypothetical protein
MHNMSKPCAVPRGMQELAFSCLQQLKIFLRSYRHHECR